MKENSRRSFIRNTSLTTTGLFFISATRARQKVLHELAIGCAPTKSLQLTGTVSSVKSGKWSDPATWGGRVPATTDTPLIASGHIIIFDLDSANIAGVNVNSGGTLKFDTTKSTTLQSSKNIVVQGTLQMRPDSSSVNQLLRFVGIDETKVAGGTMDPLDTDIGLWVMGAGKLDLSGSTKKSWTRATGTVTKGATSFSVQNASGWKVGDTVMIVPTDTPGEGTFDWDDRLNQGVDSFGEKFERRTITAINGASISLHASLTYDHLQVKTPDGAKTWTAEVANLTRNVHIEGTANGRAHIFIRSSVPQNVKYVSARYLGPRKIQSGISSRRSSVILGRYGLHFHHCMDGSRGSIVDGCAFYDMGARVYVPHVSNGITMKNNVSFKSLEPAFWWDTEDISHDTVWENNLIAYVMRNGIENKATGMALGLGDGNIARHNVAVYAHSGDVNGGGAYNWGFEGVWIFENNLAHSNRNGIFIWQNSSKNHTIINYDSYNSYRSLVHGAYGNSYTYRYGYHYNSPSEVKATSSNTSGVIFQDIIYDAAGLPFAVYFLDSPIPSDPTNPNRWIKCTFKNYSKEAIRVFTAMFDNNVEKQYKCGDLILCSFSKGKGYYFDNTAPFNLKDGFRIRVQPAVGQCYQTQRVNQHEVDSVVSPFAPTQYGTGTGLTGNYYNGSKFEKYAFSRQDSIIMFQQWRKESLSSPTGVHYAITGDQFSVRWAGKVEAQYTEPYQFRTQGSGGFRLWVNNVKIIDSWVDRADNKDGAVSTVMNLEAGKKYDIKLEHMNMGGARGCELLWKCKSLNRWVLVPQSQLYADGSSSTPDTVEPESNTPNNQRPVANAGADIVIVLPVNHTTLNGSASKDPDGTISAFKWTKVSGPSQFTIANANAATTALSNLVQGTYVFRLQVKDNKGEIETDDVKVIVNASPATDSSNSGTTVKALTITALPNPSTSNFKLQVSSNSNYPITICIYDQYYKEVGVYKNLSRGTMITVGDNFKRGIYYAWATQNEQTMTLKLIKI